MKGTKYTITQNNIFKTHHFKTIAETKVYICKTIDISDTFIINNKDEKLNGYTYLGSNNNLATFRHNLGIHNNFLGKTYQSKYLNNKMPVLLEIIEIEIGELNKYINTIKEIIKSSKAKENEFVGLNQNALKELIEYNNHLSEEAIEILFNKLRIFNTETENNTCINTEMPYNFNTNHLKTYTKMSSMNLTLNLFSSFGHPIRISYRWSRMIALVKPGNTANPMNLDTTQYITLHDIYGGSHNSNIPIKIDGSVHPWYQNMVYHILKNSNLKVSYQILENQSVYSKYCIVSLLFYLKNEDYKRMINGKMLIDKIWLKKIFKTSKKVGYHVISPTAIEEANDKISCKNLRIKYYNRKERRVEYKKMVKKYLSVVPYQHQKENIFWMTQHENDIRKNKFTYTYKNDININYTNINNSDMPYKYVNNKDGEPVVQFTKNCESNDTVTFNGGILADDVGLGKTLCCLANVVFDIVNQNPNEYELNTLILLPTRLIGQWHFELNKYLNKSGQNKIKIHCITTIKDVRKFKNWGSYDIILMSANLLVNENYLNYVMEIDKNLKSKTDTTDIPSTTDLPSTTDIPNTNDTTEIPSTNDIPNTDIFNVWNIKWNRIYVDEAHEVFIEDILLPKNYNKTLNIKYANSSGLYIHNNMRHCGNNKTHSFIHIPKIPTKIREMSAKLIMLRANYKWYISATPLHRSIINLHAIMKWFSSDINKFINNINFNSKVYLYKYLKFNTNMQSKSEPNTFYYDYNNNPYNFKISHTELVSFLSTCARSTKKIDIKGKLDIPVFTEEIIYLNQTSIEKNIYLSAVRENDISKLFMLCTHILISTGKAEFGDDFDENAIVSLSDINGLMALYYKKQQLQFKKEIESIEKSLKSEAIEECKFNKILTNIASIYTYANSNSQNHVIPYKIEGINNQIKYKSGQIMAFKVNLIGLLDLITNIADLSLITETIKKDVVCHYSNAEKGYMAIYFIKGKLQNVKSHIIRLNDKHVANTREVGRLENQIRLFESGDFLKDAIEDTCGICFMEYTDTIAITKCRHVVCGDCLHLLFAEASEINCPYCRSPLKKTNEDIRLTTVQEIEPKNEVVENTLVVDKSTEEKQHEMINKYGTKLAYLINLINDKILINKENRIIIFSQYDKMLKMIGSVLKDFNIKHLYIKGNVHTVTMNITKFKTDESYRVIMISSEKAASGMNLTEANHIIFADVINGDEQMTKNVESQAIGRAVRIGSKLPAKIIRLIMRNTIENEYYDKNKYDMTCHQF